MIYILKIGFILINKRNKFIILALIGCAAEDIRKKIMHIALSINICKTKSLYINESEIWIHKSLFIINKLNLIYLRLVTTINKSLYKT